MLYELKYDVLALKSVGLGLLSYKVSLRCQWYKMSLFKNGISDESRAQSLYLQFVSCYFCWLGGYLHGPCSPCSFSSLCSYWFAVQNDYPLKRGKKRKNKKVKRVHVCPLFLYQSAYVLSDVCDQFAYVLSEEYLLLSINSSQKVEESWINKHQLFFILMYCILLCINEWFIWCYVFTTIIKSIHPGSWDCINRGAQEHTIILPLAAHPFCWRYIYIYFFLG